MDATISALAANLRALRAKHQLSVRDVAEEVVIDPGYLSHLENGNRGNVTLQVLYRIAEFYGVTIADLLQEENAHV